MRNKKVITWLTLAAIGAALLGCRADQEREAARCELEAQKTFPNVKNMFLSAAAGDFIELCMRAAGYEFDNDNRSCFGPFVVNGSVLYEKPNPYCYVPDTEWGRMGLKLENWFRGIRPLPDH